MTHVTFLWVDKTKFAWLREGIEFYRKRLAHYVKVSICEVPAGQDPYAEGVYILKAIPKGSLLIALDVKGEVFDSHGLARFISMLETSGHSRLCFVIGGAYGLSQEVLNQAHRRISLSPLTFTHDMSRLILMEQLYRAYSIIKGAPYHH